MSKVNVVSIIIPVFNRENFVAESIESVLAQDAGSAHLQVVLVDDGSEDGSSEICDRYARENPENVVVVHQENQGVAAAFNSGLDHATGEVVGFLGSDDTFSEDTVRAVIEFYDQQWDECDLVAIKIEMFGDRGGPHWNNRKRFNRTRVIDVNTSWNQPQIHGGGTFIKLGLLREQGRHFDPRLFMSEDLTMNTQVVMQKMAYGVISEPTYYNRRYVEGGASQISSGHFRPEFYDVIPEHAYQRILDDAVELWGHAPLYVQAVVCYDMVFRFRGNTAHLSHGQREEYRATLSRILKQVSVLAIMSQNAPIEQRLNILDLREGNELTRRVRVKNGVATLEDVRVYSFDPAKRARHRNQRYDILAFDLHDSHVDIVGTLHAIKISDQVTFAVWVGSECYPIDLAEPLRVQPELLNRTIVSGNSFRMRVPFRPGEALQVVAHVKGSRGRIEEYPLEPRAGRASGLAGTLDTKYFRRNGRDVIHQIDRSRFRRSVAGGAVDVSKGEAGFLRRLRRSGVQARVIRLRLRALAARRRKRHEQMWLMADHKRDAGDNAEALFRYLCAHPELGVHPVMVLSREAAEYRELAALGEVVEPDGRRFFERFFQADVLLNSAADEYMINPLGADRYVVQDLIPPVSVFLQHGVTKDDQSSWLNWPRKAFDLVVTSAGREYESFVAGDYGYSREQVALVGMPRLDRLESKPDRLLVLAPTWRKSLVGELDQGAGRDARANIFENSAYKQSWQAIIEHPALNAALRAKGYRGLFAIHPSHAIEAESFQASEAIKISMPPHDYRSLFRSGAILATDYSSVSFDFGYLRKPVVYFQPDREEFYAGHLYQEGYYSYDEDGFGPVTMDVEGFVDAVVARIEADGTMEDAYRERVDQFFEFSGGGSARRLCEAVIDTQCRKGLRA